jgi:hypothetical protein
MWRQVRTQVRRQDLMKYPQARSPGPPSPREAGLRLLEAYADLARRGQHLLGALLGGQAPRQWAHYPNEDAIDHASGCQWFYHSHSPEDRPQAPEHGHIHLFACRPLWQGRLRSPAERDFARLCAMPRSRSNTRHLLALGLDAKGIPISLFTVNSWVTGDLMLSADLTLELLSSMALDTGHAELDTVIVSVLGLCRAELSEVLARRDAALRSHAGPAVLQDRGLEVLSQIPIDLDAALRAL